MRRILIVEDDKSISELIKLTLEMSGYDTEQAMDGKKALDIISEENFDLIILDIMLPEMDGYELMKYINKKDIPVIMLSAKDKLEDKVLGLNHGADDYVTKPFEGIELIARVKAVLRRKGKEKSSRTLGDIKVDYESRKVFKNETVVELTVKEFELLKTLIENKGIVLSRESLLEHIWGYDYMGYTRTIDAHIKNLRKKLDLDCIKTIYKIGYMLEV